MRKKAEHCFAACVCVLFLLGLTACRSTKSVSSQADASSSAETSPAVTTALPTTGWVTATTLRVFSKPHIGSEVIGGLEKGDKFTITGKEGDWYAFVFKEGITGYVSGQYIQFTQPAVSAP